MMRPLQLAAIRAFGIGRRTQGAWCERRMLRRDGEVFFFGTAMTISTTGRRATACPQNSYGRAYQARRADFSSQNVPPPQQFSGRGAACPSRRPVRQTDAGAARAGQAGRPVRGLGSTSSSFTPGRRG